MNRMKTLVGLGVFGIAMIVASPAEAVSYSFFRITNNGATNVEAQLSVDVLDAGGGQVDFTFYNNVGTAASITDVYFDDGGLLGIASISSTAGVAFSQGASPSDLPAGNSMDPQFDVSSTFSADSDSPVAANGVNASTESLTIRFNLISGQTYANVLDYLDLGMALGPGDDADVPQTLRIGLHVQSITGNYSDSFTTQIPVPGAALLGALGLGLVGWRREKTS